METVFLSIGTNLGQKEENLRNAVAMINSEAGRVAASSSIYETEPWQMESGNTFFNMVVEIETSLCPDVLLAKLLEIENRMGRVRRSNIYISRIIDIDILFFDSLIINAGNLTIPHPHIAHRRFVLEPLAEITSSFIHPVLKKSVETLLESCPDECVVRKTGIKL